MTSKDEALKTAIEGYEECLENLQGWAAYASEYFQDKWDLEGEVKDHKDKINACKEALEQPAQDYVLICKKCGDELGIEYVPDEQPKMTYEQGFDHGYEAHRIEQENDKQQTIASIWEGISEIEQPAQEPDDLMQGRWIRFDEDDDTTQLLMELEIAMNGIECSAKSPAVIDVLRQAVDYFKIGKKYHKQTAECTNE